MLSKSAAKVFFLGGTLLFTSAFVLLTIDTFTRIPGQTHGEKLSPEVINGKNIWDKNNCMGCHTLLGEGAYYAPELTKVYQRRGPAFIKAQLTDPEAMFPGQRKMQNYHFTDAEMESLIAFFKWIGEMDLNGYPAKANLAIPQPNLTGETKIRPQIFNQMCVVCHTLSGHGGEVGPVLDGVGSRRDTAYLTQWLKDPKQVKPDSKMPKMPLTESEISELVNFLAQQKE